MFAVKTSVIFFLFLVLTTIVYVVSLSPASVQAVPVAMRNVSISIIVYNASFDIFAEWIGQYSSFHNYTFIVNPEKDEYTWLTENKTRVDFLTSLGEVIPATLYAIQKYTLQNRTDFFNRTINEWKDKLGYAPVGFFMYQPDTYSLNFLKANGINYSMGYCFDQYVIDHMTMRGGWQLPYYANSQNALIPENKTEGGIMVLPWLTWDWVDSFTLSHLYESETICSPAANPSEYVTSLIERNLDSCFPISYSAFSFDFNWYCNQRALTDAGIVLGNLLRNDLYQKYSCGNFTNWFKTHYSATPAYTVNFASPNSGEDIEWFYNKQCRVARHNMVVVSYVDYTNQQVDKYLTTNANVDWSLPSSLTNCVNTSLSFTVDALGGGQYRAPAISTGVSYSGSLSDFPEYYRTLLSSEPTPTATTPEVPISSPTVAPSSSLIAPGFSTSVLQMLILAAFLFFLYICAALISRARKVNNP
jgi:hypothetical protein